MVLLAAAFSLLIMITSRSMQLLTLSFYGLILQTQSKVETHHVKGTVALEKKKKTVTVPRALPLPLGQSF